ncbi:MAG: DNA-directed RNA polymerase subunit beta [Candidatus Colwellbacteria bacterium RIFCSPLOWO2_12_FULL_44_13]|uniref:DNA-directed RNA polymerase subunit beta n=2 Tax=Candidatus Colwelliibacteriota TaxID=1817904 RepID=A0A1G1ZAG0_9BACT|nr:MAG: DNA-directed RNA polymerase subunit beta [Candidatus Colwellbacteria bacterium RIFCSPLOWO2_12_FULL_44_13]
MSKLPLKIFSSRPGQRLAIPNLVELQTLSYKWFLEKGIKELFKEVSPIHDYSGKELELHFLDYAFDNPKYDEAQARFKGITYEAPLRARVKLIDIKTGHEKEQEVYLGDFPYMTERGSFIINGVERVIISQLIRSPGVYFTANIWRGKKLFGAKVIPLRGAWLEFETDSDGSIVVKIDRRRKVVVSDLLRVLGVVDNEELKKAFADIDCGTTKHIEATLKKDAAKNLEESYVEIYKRIRPEDLPTGESAKSLIDAMFTRADRYDLSPVGRFKVNQRLDDANEKGQFLTKNDIIKIVREIIRLNNEPLAEPDDIDHLGNRQVRAVGDLLQNRLRVGFARLKRIVQDRMSTLEPDALTPVQLVNARPLVAVVREFFSSSQMSQFMDQVNPLTELEHKRRVSALGPGGLTRERAGFEVRDVHVSHYGRICPIQTPEGANIGLINYLANFSKINEFGFLETPYARVKNGKVTNEIVWFDAIDEQKHSIAHAGVEVDKEDRIVNDVVEARVKGEPGSCARSEVEFIDVATNQILSIATSLIPFLEHDDANRALMGSNMQRQAVPSIRPQAPYVGTGMEEKAAEDSGYLIISDRDGEVIEADAAHIVIKSTKSGTKEFTLHKFKRTNQNTCVSQRPLVTIGQKVKKGDVLADGPAIDNGALALGQNLLVAFVSWQGANFEDAIVLSEKVVRDSRFASIYIEDFICDVRDTKLGPEITTMDIPNVSEEKLKNLDEEGIIRIGAEAKAGDVLVGKISPKGESELTSEERLLRAIFGEKASDVKDTSLTLPHGKQGRVVGIKIFHREQGDKLDPGVIKRIEVQVAQVRNIRAGDKMAGRHGNKGVVAKIWPIEDMPYLEDGTPVDIVLNPLGVASRMNLGQIYETHLGWAASKLGYRAATTPLAGATEAEIKAELKKAGLPESGKVVAYDGRTGQAFDQPITVGIKYMMKLNHLVEDKIHMRSIGPYSLITQQPLGGKAQFGGQRFGEMEVWALEGYGAAHTLQEMLTIKSDDIMGRSSVYESIIRGEKIKKPNIPASFNVLVNEMKALGIAVELLNEGKSDDPSIGVGNYEETEE